MLAARLSRLHLRATAVCSPASPVAAAAGALGRSLHQSDGSCPNTVWSLINSSPDLSTLKEAVEAAGLRGELPKMLVCIPPVWPTILQM